MGDNGNDDDALLSVSLTEDGPSLDAVSLRLEPAETKRFRDRYSRLRPASAFERNDRVNVGCPPPSKFLF